jgi:hypothetical protein
MPRWRETSASRSRSRHPTALLIEHFSPVWAEELDGRLA